MAYSDTEQRREYAEDMENHEREKKPRKSRIYKIVHFFGGGIYAPDASVFDPIEVLLNTKNPEERDRLTDRWKDNRLQELNFVGVVAALLAGVLTSTGSWPNILPNGELSPWPIRTSWYCGIILSLFSLLTAADQTVRLHRMASHCDSTRLIHNMLSKSTKVQRDRDRSSVRVRIQPSTACVYVWQLPVMFLTTATVSMIVGMFLHVWSASATAGSMQWSKDTKVAVTFSSVAVASIFIFFAGQVMLYVPDNERS